MNSVREPREQAETYPKAFLVVFSRVEPSQAEEFNKWYDEHLLTRLGVRGWYTARRYQDVADEYHYLGCYDLRDEEVLRGSAYLSLIGERRPERERRMIREAKLMDRRVYCYDQLANPAAGTELDRDPDDGRRVTATWHVTGEAQDTLDIWLRDTYLPAFAAEQGWRRSRVFHLSDGQVPPYLVVHDYDRRIAEDRLYELDETFASAPQRVQSRRDEFCIWRLMREFPPSIR